MRIAKSVKLLGWGVSGIGIVVVAAYLCLFVINIPDQQPSESALSFTTLIDHNKKAGDSQAATQNAYLVYRQYIAAEPEALSDELRQLVSACHLKDCSAQLHQAKARLSELLSQHPGLHVYPQLRALNYWHEPFVTDSEQILPYQPLRDLQSMLLLQAWLAAQDNDVALASQLLQEDLSFWRSLLVNNTSLFSKMTSVAAIEQHFTFASLIRNALPDSQQALLTPAGWQDPFSEAELSLTLAYAGEWLYASHMLGDELLQDAADTDINGYEHVLLTLAKPLFNEQASKNDRAAWYLQCSTGQKMAQRPWYSWLYNPVGKLSSSDGVSHCLSYYQRVQQLELLRHSALRAS